MRAERRNARRTVRSSTEGTADVSLRGTRPNQKLRCRDRSFNWIFNVNIKFMLGVCVIVFIIIIFLIREIAKPVEEIRTQKLRVVTPFPAPKVMDLPQFQGEHRESLYWGTYRPHVYLGIRSRTPKSLIAGLMWIGIKEGRYYLRHMCQDSDGLHTYGWRRHNGRDFGHQELVDYDFSLSTSFLKSKTDGSGFGGDWAVRIHTYTEDSKWTDESGRTAHLFFYLADESGHPLTVSRDSLDNHEDSLLVSGSRHDIGNWQLHLKSTDDLDVHYCGFKTDHFHNLSELVQGNLAAMVMRYGELQLSDSSENFPNVVVFQISGRVPFKSDLVLISGTNEETSRIEQRVISLTGLSLTNQLKNKEKEFDEKFERTFNLSDKLDSDSISVGKAAIGNLLGGIGYFYGQSIISLPKNLDPNGSNEIISYWPAELYTAVPSRPFFPRGFLWDEGFHQLLIWRWDIKICLDILGHWLDLMNADGWIPREQILGAEALSKVPEEFVPQHPTHGNPPTLFLVLRDIVQKLKKNEFSANETNEISLFLDQAFVRLEAWFQWFNTSQSGALTGSYYWHGRDNKTTRELNPKTLSSGLDDYPRASHPNGDERHVDLRCWMLLAAECLNSITELVGKKLSLGKDYGATAKLLSDFEILNQMHFDDAYGAYFDFGNHTEKVRLSWKEILVGHNYRREFLRDVLETPKLRLVPHIGYVGLFPFMERLIPLNSWILEKQLDHISNRSILWTDYGLRSLSTTSTLYMKRNTEHDPPYWRGAIWMNMNYRILSALYHYAEEEGPYKERARTIYNDLRSNLIRNLVQNYRKTGFLWEHYDQDTGKGEGARLFTGWTSLVLLIMAEAYGES